MQEKLEMLFPDSSLENFIDFDACTNKNQYAEKRHASILFKAFDIFQLLDKRGTFFIHTFFLESPCV